MSQTEMLSNRVSEYKGLVAELSDQHESCIDSEQLIKQLLSEYDWTDRGAKELVALANGYGTFMLRNALALAIALDKEDGDFGF
jgi:hypothetical protein